MSVALSQQPQAYQPAYNPQIFVGLSNQIAQPDFIYVITVYDLISSVQETYRIPKRPSDDRFVFDAGPFAESFMTNTPLINNYGVNLCPNIRKIRVNVSEEYGGVFYVGSDYDYIIWNSIVDYKDYPTYDDADFIFQASTDRPRYLTNRLNDITFDDRSNLLYLLSTASANDVYSFTINTYNYSGSFIGSSTINNPFYSSSTYTDKYLVFDVGKKGLDNIASGVVSGDYPILTDSIYYYDVVVAYDNGSGFVNSTVKRIYIECEPKFTVYTVHFLAKSGAFESIHFNKLSELNKTKQVTSFKQLPFTMSSGTYSYSAHTPVEKVLSTIVNSRFKLNTNWLDEDHIELYSEMFDSPCCYLDLGNSVDYIPLKVITDSYKISKKWNDKLYSLTIEFEYTHQDQRQRG